MTNKPFATALQAELDEREWSGRELARRLDAEFGRKDRISQSVIRLYLTGELPPTRSAMERIAAVLRIDPDHFAEHRLEVVRDDLNWRVVGTPRALSSLARLDRTGKPAQRRSQRSQSHA